MWSCGFIECEVSLWGGENIGLLPGSVQFLQERKKNIPQFLAWGSDGRTFYSEIYF